VGANMDFKLLFQHATLLLLSKAEWTSRPHDGNWVLSCPGYFCRAYCMYRVGITGVSLSSLAPHICSQAEWAASASLGRVGVGVVGAGMWSYMRADAIHPAVVS
jgi:hypothetical protein